MRQEIRRRPKDSDKQFRLFEDELYGQVYRHSLYITNKPVASPYEIWSDYRPPR